MDVLRKARRIVPNSGYTKDWTLDVFGDEFKKNIRVIPGGVDVDKFVKSSSTAHLDAMYGLKDKKVVLFAGKLTKYKGVEYLVKAARKIPAEILIVGDGPERKKLEYIKEKYAIKNVQFLGHQGNNTKHLIDLYSRADVFVAPSIWDEPLGLVVLEAMACETPVIVTRKGGIPLAVKEGKNGLFIRSKKVNDLAEKVNYLLANDKKRIAMGQRARDIAVKRFSWEIIAGKFNRMYERFGLK